MNRPRIVKQLMRSLSVSSGSSRIILRFQECSPVAEFLATSWPPGFWSDPPQPRASSVAACSTSSIRCTSSPCSSDGRVHCLLFHFDILHFSYVSLSSRVPGLWLVAITSFSLSTCINIDLLRRFLWILTLVAKITWTTNMGQILVLDHLAYGQHTAVGSSTIPRYPPEISVAGLSGHRGPSFA